MVTYSDSSIIINRAADTSVSRNSGIVYSRYRTD